MPRMLTVAACCIAAIALAACSSTKRVDGGRYSTINAEPRRDTDRAQALNLKAADLLDEGAYQEASAILEEAIDADVTFGPAHNNLGKAYFHLGDYYRAAWEYRYAVKLMPHHPEPRNNLGLVLEQTGRLQDAIAEYDQAVEIAPDHPEVLGNLIRARIRRGEHGPQIIDLLERLLATEQRPEWRSWAQERLALMRARTTDDPPEPITP